VDGKFVIGPIDWLEIDQASLSYMWMLTLQSDQSTGNYTEFYMDTNFALGTIN